jgi:hypothetical protein
MYDPEDLDELEAEIKLLTMRYKKLKKQCDIEKKKSEEIQILNSKYKDKIKYLLIELEKSHNAIKTVDKSTGELLTVTLTNKNICSNLVEKLNRVKTELPENFEISEWNNKHFVNYLIDLTLEELLKLKF